MRAESRKDQRAALSAALRADGWTWEEVAQEFRRRERCSPLLGLRWAHGLSQQDVADAYNQRLTPDPDDKPIDFRRVSRWEQWPEGGSTPPLDALNRLAEIYQVRAAFLFEGEDYRHLDSAYQPDANGPLLTEPLLRQAISPDTAHGDARPPGSGNTLVLHPGQLAEFRHGPPGRRDGEHGPSPHLFVLHGRNPMERRAVLAAIASLPGVTILPDQPSGSRSLLDPEGQDIISHAIKRPESVGPKALIPLGELIMGYRHLDDTLGSRYITEPLTVFLRMMRVILPAAESSVRQPLFSLAASASQLAGWLALDSGDSEQARKLYDQAIEWATAADDAAMTAYLWTCRSVLAYLNHDPLGAMSTAEAARRIAAGQHWKLRAWIECMAGHAYALAGNGDETLRAMNEAVDLFADAEPDGAPEWLYHFHPEDLTAERAFALIDLGEGVRAAEMLAGAIEQLSPAFVRDRGVWLANQANAFRVVGDVKLACATGTEALLIGRQTGSARTIEKVGRLHRSLDEKAAQSQEASELGGLLREDATA